MADENLSQVAGTNLCEPTLLHVRDTIQEAMAITINLLTVRIHAESLASGSNDV